MNKDIGFDDQGIISSFDFLFKRDNLCNIFWLSLIMYVCGFFFIIVRLLQDSWDIIYVYAGEGFYLKDSSSELLNFRWLYVRNFIQLYFFYYLWCWKCIFLGMYAWFGAIHVNLSYIHIHCWRSYLLVDKHFSLEFSSGETSSRDHARNDSSETGGDILRAFCEL